MSTASNSSEAITRNGSPDSKAHGASARVSRWLNHRAVAGFGTGPVVQPPNTTVSEPSALASMRKSSPRAACSGRHSRQQFPSRTSLNHRSVSRTKSGTSR